MNSGAQCEQDRANLHRECILMAQELGRLRKRVVNQRRELRRMNKQIQPYWKGFVTGLHYEGEIRLRGIMNKAFGWQKVREAELAAIPTQASDGGEQK
jgi:hypothetical protein